MAEQKKKKAEQTEPNSEKEGSDDDEQESEEKEQEKVKTETTRASMTIKNTIQLTKYRSPQGVVLNSRFKRFHMDDVLKQKSKIPAPNQYLTANKKKEKIHTHKKNDD